MGTLIIGAGGGGDAITGSALAGPLGLTELPVVITYSWDRLLIDPLPGPRSANDFTGLRHLAPRVLEVVDSTQPAGGAGSSLPRLAAELPTRLVLLDAAGGAVDMAVQIRAAAEFFDTDEVVLIDVGGDALTNGTDPGLRSPLADQLAIAACVRSGLHVRVLIAAPGIDGELSAETVQTRLRALNADQLPDLTGLDLAPVRPIFNWHPSEASGLLAAAASGRRGCVEVRDAGDHVTLTANTPALFSVGATDTLEMTPSVSLTESRSLAEAEEIMRQTTGISEIRYETEKANRLRAHVAHFPTHADLSTVDKRACEASSRGADYISVRRLSELLGATTLDTFAALSDLLAIERPGRYEPSIYRASPTP